MSPEFLTIQQDKETSIITLNRPERYNAMNRVLKNELAQAIRDANHSLEIRTIIITGAGKAFCSGQDLQDRSVQAGERPVDLGDTLEQEWIPLIQALRESSKLVIGAINGVVAGAGVSVALACDFLLSKPQVKWVSGFAQLGLVPDAGSTYTLTRELGRQRALAFFLTGAPLTSEELQRAGVIYEIHDQVMPAAQQLAQKLNGLAPLSVAAIKKNMQFALDHDYPTCLQREVQEQRRLGQSRDYQEGVAAFLGKRPAVFKGE